MWGTSNILFASHWLDSRLLAGQTCKAAAARRRRRDASHLITCADLCLQLFLISFPFPIQSRPSCLRRTESGVQCGLLAAKPVTVLWDSSWISLSLTSMRRSPTHPSHCPSLRALYSAGRAIKRGWGHWHTRTKNNSGFSMIGHICFISLKPYFISKITAGVLFSVFPRWQQVLYMAVLRKNSCGYSRPSLVCTGL